MGYQLPKQLASGKTQAILKQAGPWYHKGFHAFPLTLGMVADALMTYGKKQLPWTLPFGLGFYRREQNDWFWNKPWQFRLRQKSIAAQLKNPNFIVRITRARAKAQTAFEREVLAFRKLNLRKLPLNRIWSALERVLTPYAEMWGWGVISEPFLGDGEEWLATALRPELEKKFSLVWTNKLHVLVAPTSLSFVNSEHLSLLKLAHVLRQSANTPKLKRLITEHAERYWWIEDNYSVFHNYSEKHFFKKALAHLNQQPNKNRQTLLAHHLKQLKQKRALVKGLSGQAQRLVKLSDELTASSDGRKSCVFKMSYVWFTSLGELSRRLNLPLKELMYAMPGELAGWFKGKRVNRKELRRRRQGCLHIYTTQGFSLQTLTPKKYNSLLARFLGDRGAAHEVKGITACPGRAQGRVRVVITPAAIRQVKLGEILVTNNTTPDFVPAMRKAAAIVTEQGGITSHAALVSRELKVPCVIGTRTATRVFKTGDRVEVDATRGVVRKLT